jgi:guanine nucleotide-binding protein subunit alpha
MRLIHACGFKASEREGFRIVVFFNMFNTIQTLLEALDSLDLQIADPSLRVSCSLAQHALF